MFVSRSACSQRTGLAEVRELAFRPPTTAADLKTDDEDNEQKLN
jgi:hypothetical protein